DGAGVVSKIEFGTVTAKVRFAHVVVGADHAALEDGEEIFGGVGVLEAARGDVFASAVIDLAVAVELAAHALIDRALVRHKVRGAIDVRDNERANVLGVDVGDMEGTGVAVTLDKGDNSLLGSGLAGGAVLGLAADIGFIGFDNAVRAAERAARLVHGFTDA